MELRNLFLEQVMRKVREHRPLLPKSKAFYNRFESVRAGTFAEVWFMTRGCSWDHQGGCTMCNYGRGEDLNADEIVDAVQAALDDLKREIDELLVSPSGGMLDSAEVPISTRRRIYGLVREFPSKKFLIETRCETITEDAVKELVEAVPDRKLGIEVGLESSCAWIQRFCVNKGSHPDNFRKAAAIARRFDVDFYANVALGTAFLSVAEAIDDCCASVRWALSNGATNAIVFPLHVKPYTLLNRMFDEKLYRPPSLWSLVEVLRELGPELQGHTEIAWYRSYYDDPSKIMLSPTTCPQCIDRVLDLLDGYRATQSSAYVDQLSAITCSCKDSWRRELAASPQQPLQERTFGLYELLAENFDLQPWWKLNSAAVRLSMFSTVPHVGAPAIR